MSAPAAHPARRSLSVAAVVVACALLTAASGRNDRSAGSGTAVSGVVARVVDQGVAVTFRWADGARGARTLVATFTPIGAGFHLYSAQLPTTGVQGIGRPTRVEPGGALTAAGTAVVDRTAVDTRVAGVDEPVPTYPAGPVTLYAPVRVTPGRSDAVAWVTYAACSAAQCLPPVEHRRVLVPLPAP